ncbi:hypothetical protein GGF31_007606 [Allomyces arbusculus]|nr:hypothetical protein GGF31_007606 [Allomyces arbusculus]
MSSARALFREAKAAKLGASSAAAAATPRVRHPLAAYDAAGRLRCTACALPVKSATAWPVHLASQAHKNAVRQAAAPAPSASAAVKRKADVLDDAAPVAPQQQRKKPAETSRLVAYAGSDDDDEEEDDVVPPQPTSTRSGPAVPQRDASPSGPNNKNDGDGDSAALPTGFFDADMAEAGSPAPDADPAAADEPDSTLPAGFFDATVDAPAPPPPPVVDDDPMADNAPISDASAPATDGTLPAGFFADTQPANLDAEYAAFQAELAQDTATTADPAAERDEEEDLDAMFRRIQAERDADEQQTLAAMQARVRALAEHRPRAVVDATAVPEVAALEELEEVEESGSDVDSDEEMDNWRARRI